ncbi:MAG: inositol phosphorylceramide synthase [Actinobacteria bacterium]|nr:inositol phosphorylceramide synthase [Actinomycetota bacterium]
MTYAGFGWMPWRTALVVAAVLLVLMGLFSLSQRTRPSVRILGEVAVILGLYAAWQYVGAMSRSGLDQAAQAGLWLADIERFLGWPTEASLQQPILGNDGLVAAADTYYASLHAPVFIVTLIWVLALHRRDWPFTRTVAILVTGACLLVQFKPVAPPRLLPSLGIIDTALENGRSVYAAVPGANQLSAMPSVHIAWAGAVALFVIVSARSSWRWLALAYPGITLWVVVVTGNHFIVDGLVALILLAVAVAVTVSIPSQRPERFVRLLARQNAGSAVPEAS